MSECDPWSLHVSEIEQAMLTGSNLCLCPGVLSCLAATALSCRRHQISRIQMNAHNITTPMVTVHIDMHQ